MDVKSIVSHTQIAVSGSCRARRRPRLLAEHHRRRLLNANGADGPNPRRCVAGRSQRPHQVHRR
jgi:hypothetical protein